MTKAAQDCDVIVNGLNPPNYHNWAEIVPQITRDVIAAAKASGATVIVPGNVYIYGDTPGEWSETTTLRPCSRKGKIRLDMERAYADSDVQTIVLRAGNFIDPDRNADVMNVLLLTRLQRGKVVSPGDPQALQSWCYLPDWARAAVALAERRETLSRFEDVPFPGHSFSVAELLAHLQTELGRPLRLARFPWWLFRVAAPVWELAREVNEMRYLWDTSHTLSGRKLAALLPDFEPTSLRIVLQSLVPENRT